MGDTIAKLQGLAGQVGAAKAAFGGIVSTAVSFVTYARTKEIERSQAALAEVRRKNFDCPHIMMSSTDGVFAFDKSDPAIESTLAERRAKEGVAADRDLADAGVLFTMAPGGGPTLWHPDRFFSPTGTVYWLSRDWARDIEKRTPVTQGSKSGGYINHPDGWCRFCSKNAEFQKGG